MVYAPSRAVIPDKVCIVRSNYINKFLGKEPKIVTFNAKIYSPPDKTIAIITNEFLGPFIISDIMQSNSSFYSWLTVENAIPSGINPTLNVNLRHWALNEVIMQGLVGKGGKIASEAKFVAVTYAQYSTLIFKGGLIYKKILGL